MCQCLCCAPARAKVVLSADPDAAIPTECVNLKRRVPVTIVSGFLGAGKTTFINWILEGAHGKKFCVIQNEIGATTIAASLMLRGENFAATAVMTEADGCICCTVREDLVEALKSVAKSLVTDRVHVDGILVETSGLSELGPVVRTFFADSFVLENFRLDAVVAVVDALSAPSMLRKSCPLFGDAGAQSNGGDAELRDECDVSDAHERSSENDTACLLCERLSLADVVLMNKCDLVPTEELERVSELVLQVNPTSVLIPCNRGRVDLSSVLDIQGFSFSLQAPDVVSTHRRTRHLHHGFGSVICERDSDLDELAFTDWLDGLLEEHGNRIYRTKGVLFFHGVETASALQCVQQHVEVERVYESMHNSEGRHSWIVFIGAVSEHEEVLAEGFASLQ